jgi:hypothetical protein
MRRLLVVSRLFIVVSTAIICSFVVAVGQSDSLSIKVMPGPDVRVIVEGIGHSNSWAFRDSYAGMLGLGSRVEGLTVFDGDGRETEVRKIAPGRFETNGAGTRFSYAVKLTPPVRASDAALISWANEERGVLMLRDLLPTFLLSANERGLKRIRLELPPGWQGYSSEKQSGASEIEATDYDRTVIAIGKNLRQTKEKVDGSALNLIVDGHWAFTDADALDLAAQVLKAHRDVFGLMPSDRVTLILFPFPAQVSADRWAAETRGSTVTLLIGKMPSKTGALAQLSTPLTHELFHLWVPNGLALEGDYDWFYEGFTVYQAARTAVDLGLLTFPEFLNAIARAYDGFRAAQEVNGMSLIEASRRRWTTGGSSVYSKSLVTAFLYDLRLRNATNGKRTLESGYRKLFERHRPTGAVSKSTDGNEAVFTSFTDSVSSDFFGFVRQPIDINLESELAPFGLRAEQFGLRTRISVAEKLTKRQRDLLRGLGYNDLSHAPRSK